MNNMMGQWECPIMRFLKEWYALQVSLQERNTGSSGRWGSSIDYMITHLHMLFGPTAPFLRVRDNVIY